MYTPKLRGVVEGNNENEKELQREFFYSDVQRVTCLSQSDLKRESELKEGSPSGQAGI